MKPAPFAYVQARDVEHALALWQEAGEDARLIAGGQSLVASLNLRLADVPVLIDIARIESLRGIDGVGSVLRLGAMTTHRDIERSALVAHHAPMMAAAAPLIAHPAIRTRGTLGGSLAYADPAAEWPACMVALGAILVTAGPAGERRIAAEAFFLGLFETALQPFEMIVAVEVPVLRAGVVQHVTELARRTGDYAMVGLAATTDLSGGAPSATRLVYFGAGDRPVLAQNAMTAIDSGAEVEAVLALLDEDLDPADDLQASGAMKRHLAKVLLRRSLDTMTRTRKAA
jgi:aerobic carbon-monoxide dehydrogenase medium subunit